MEREQLDRLLAEYATGGLSEAEKKKLFAAALADQDLFDRLTDEDELREAIEMPGARNRLIESLEELKPAPSLAPSLPRRRPMWLAWAAGIGVMFVSGAITFLMFEASVSRNAMQVSSEAPFTTKPFVVPPLRVEKQRKAIIDEPPKIIAEARERTTLARPVNIPLPTAPPPAEPVPLPDGKSGKVVITARAGRDSDFRPIQQYQTPQPAPFRQQPGLAGGPPASPADSVENLEAAKGARAERSAMALPAPASRAGGQSASLWRRGDGVWFRVPTGDAIGRDDAVVIRYVPTATVDIALLDPTGRRVGGRPGRAGEELELIIPRALLQGAAGDSIIFSIVEGARATPFKILLRQR